MAPGRRQRLSYQMFRAASVVANAMPRDVAVPAARALGRLAVPFAGRKRALLARHLRRVSAGALDRRQLRRMVCLAYMSYGRYWMESFRLPSMPPEDIDAGFSIEGLEHIRAAREVGRGAILALPHLGGWEVGGAWFVRQGFPLTVVVEPLQPPELFEWFVGLRRSFGFKVVPLGTAAGAKVVRALRANEVVALLSDRDIGGGGIEVEFFGERTTLPAGPATLAMRLDVALLPTAVYFRGDGHHAVVRPPVPLDGDVEAVTQRLAVELEGLIRRAPDQWHLLQPNWPSDLVTR